MGLFPYIFIRRRHISFTLTLVLSLQLDRILISILYQYGNLLARLVPTETPSFLIPVIVVIETVRNIIRPLTLPIRLTGYLLLTLLGSQRPILRMFNLILLIGDLFILLLLEVAVACIQ